MATINELAESLLSCVCVALEEAGRPACSCGKVVGPPVVRTPCCECDGTPGVTGDLTINFETKYPADPETLDRVTRVYPCRRGTANAADFTLVLTRCYPTVQEDLQLPSPEEWDEATEEFHEDVDIMWKALTCCPGVRLRWRDLVVTSDPEGGCSYLAARVTVEA